MHRSKVFTVGVGVILCSVIILSASAAEFTGIRNAVMLEWSGASGGVYSVQADYALTGGWHEVDSVVAASNTVRWGDWNSGYADQKFYRLQIISLPQEMRLVAGGGQPSGPSYDFYMARFLVSNEDFAQFLTDAKLNQGNERGANMHFGTSGNVFMDSSESSSEKLFSIDNLDFYGWNNVQPGIVYTNGRYVAVSSYRNHPVIGVSWFGAIKYCNWKTINDGRGSSQRCYSEGTSAADWHPVTLSNAQWADGFDDTERLAWVMNASTRYGYRLPTDVEYYKAASWNGTNNTTYGFGRDSLGSSDANYQNSGDPFDSTTAPYTQNGGPTTPNGFYIGYKWPRSRGEWFGGAEEFQTNPNDNQYEIYDMSGNVNQWMTDYASGTLERSRRGGSWYTWSSSLYTWNTYSSYPYSTLQFIGFRVVSTDNP